MQDHTQHIDTDTKDDRISPRSYESTGREQQPDPETDQFRYDTPYDGGSVSDRAGINAAKEGKLVADKEDVEQAKDEVEQKTGHTP